MQRRLTTASASLWRLRTREARHFGQQLDCFVLTRADQRTGRTGVLPRAITLTDAGGWPDQRAQIDQLVRHRGGRLLLTSGEIKFLDSLGRLRKALLNHQVLVEILAARPHPANVERDVRLHPV